MRKASETVCCKQEREDRLRRGDLILIAALLVFAGVFLIFRAATVKPGAVASVVLDGEEIAVYSLSENQTVRLESENGGYNILVIQDGEIQVSEADCPDKVCVHRGKIQASGETVVCLPHRLVITVQGGNDDGILK